MPKSRTQVSNINLATRKRRLVQYTEEESSSSSEMVSIHESDLDMDALINELESALSEPRR